MDLWAIEFFLPPPSNWPVETKARAGRTQWLEEPLRGARAREPLRWAWPVFLLFSFAFCLFHTSVTLLISFPFLLSFTFASRLRHRASMEVRAEVVLEVRGHSSKQRLGSRGWFELNLKSSEAKGCKFSSKQQWLEVARGTDDCEGIPPRPREAMGLWSWTSRTKVQGGKPPRREGTLFFNFSLFPFVFYFLKQFFLPFLVLAKHT